MRLIVLRGPSPAGPFELREGLNHAGRGPECEVFLPSKRVSRQHAVFEVVGGRVQVRDLGSHNGVLADDGSRVDALALAPGERVQVGDFLLRLEAPVDELDLEEEEEDDDIVLDDETADVAVPASRPAAPVAAPVAAPIPPPPVLPFGPRGQGFGKPVPSTSRAPASEPTKLPSSKAPSRPDAPTGPARASAPAKETSTAPIPPPPVLPFPPSAGFGARGGRGVPPDPSRSIVAEPDETRSDIAPPPWMPSKAGADPETNPGLAAPPPAAPRSPPPGPVAAPLPFGPPAGGFTAQAPAAAPRPVEPPPPPPRAVVAPAAPPAPRPTAGPRPEPMAAAPARPTVAPAAVPAIPDLGPAVRAAGVPWVAQAALVVIAVLAVISCTNLLHVQGRAADVEAVSLLRGVAIADSVANRNAQPLADQRGIALDTAFALEREGVTSASVIDPRGTVLAPAERLRTSVNANPAYQAVSTTGEPAVIEGEGGKYEIAVPIRGQVGGTGPRQIVGYALLTYDPAAVAGGSMLMGLASSLFVTAVVAALLVAGAWWLLLRPLAALREETELALLGDNYDVSSPIRLAQMEQLAHSINRVVARARAAGGQRPR